MQRSGFRKDGVERGPNRPTSPPPTTSSYRETLNLWIYRYNLHTSLYMLEPWERALFNSIVLALLAYVIYCLYYAALHPLLERFATSYM